MQTAIFRFWFWGMGAVKIHKQIYIESSVISGEATLTLAKVTEIHYIKR